MMSEALPYREAGSKPRRPPPDELVCPWQDGENLANPMRYFVGFTFGAMIFGALGMVSIYAALAFAALVIGWLAWGARARRGPSSVTLHAAGGRLVIERAPGADPVYIQFEALRNVEVESKAIRRTSYRQDVGAPLPSTNLSGDVDVARVVFVLDGGAAPVRLTETYASYSECMTIFGKVRVFLRAHGWLPEDERTP